MKAFFLVGPTATGKTAVAQCLAEKHNLAVLSADSMLVYRGMDIGTAKPTALDRAKVSYGGLDLVTPDCDFSVWQYREQALWFAADQSRQGRGPMVVGGSGLYIRALLGGLAGAGSADPTRRAHGERLLAEGGVEALRDELARLRPELLAALADPYNPRRLLRALESAESSTAEQRTWRRDDLQPPPVLCGLRVSPDVLARRIEDRARNMFARGLIEEVQRLIVRWPQWSRTARQAIGYAETLAVLDGKSTQEEARQRTVVRTRQLAKKQRTWFRHQEAVEWVDAARDEDANATAERVWEVWQRHGSANIVGD